MPTAIYSCWIDWGGFESALELLNSDVYLSLFGLPTGLEIKLGQEPWWSLGNPALGVTSGRQRNPADSCATRREMPPSSSTHLNHHSRGWRPGFVRPVRPSSKPVSSQLITEEASVQRKVWKAVSQPHCTRNQGTIPSPILLHKTEQGDTALSRCWHHRCFALIRVMLALKEHVFLHQAFLQGTRIAQPSMY